jgi:hypothetical protein
MTSARTRRAGRSRSLFATALLSAGALAACRAPPRTRSTARAEGAPAAGLAGAPAAGLDGEAAPRAGGRSAAPVGVPRFDPRPPSTSLAVNGGPQISLCPNDPGFAACLGVRAGRDDPQGLLNDLDDPRLLGAPSARLPASCAGAASALAAATVGDLVRALRGRGDVRGLCGRGSSDRRCALAFRAGDDAVEFHFRQSAFGPSDSFACRRQR